MLAMLIVSESYQKNGAVSNQLKDVERGVGVFGVWTPLANRIAS